MSGDDFERWFNNKIEAILETKARNGAEIARILEAVAGMIQVVRSHEERLDRHDERLDRVESLKLTTTTLLVIISLVRRLKFVPACTIEEGRQSMHFVF